jgi:hypothetical protein
MSMRGCVGSICDELFLCLRGNKNIFDILYIYIYAAALLLLCFCKSVGVLRYAAVMHLVCRCYVAAMLLLYSCYACYAVVLLLLLVESFFVCHFALAFHGIDFAKKMFMVGTYFLKLLFC